MLHIICDIDNTVADGSARAYLVERPKPDWEAFLDPTLVSQDLPIEAAQRGLERLRKNAKIIFLTGRHEGLREATSEWIKKYFDIIVNPSNLLMRPIKNREVPSKFKKAQLIKFLEENATSNDVIMCFDDDVYALNMYNELGLIAFKAPECWNYFHSDTLKLDKEGYWRR